MVGLLIADRGEEDGAILPPAGRRVSGNCGRKQCGLGKKRPAAIPPPAGVGQAGRTTGVFRAKNFWKQLKAGAESNRKRGFCIDRRIQAQPRINYGV